MIESYLVEWGNLLLRWLHVVTAIAWIGTSFHFVLTDDRLYKPTDPDLLAKGVDGESWAVHGGGFYHFNKYRVAPPTLPALLHWSYWESYATWMSGFALLTVLYFVNASTFLVDPRVHDWSPGAAIAGALAYLVVGWIVYDGICRLVGRDAQGNVGGDTKVGVLVFVYVCVAAWIACHLFAGRAAFLLTGAMLATMMTANVAMVIIPGQRKVVAALRAGQAPDPNHGKRGKQRSVHNTYVTLPVIVAMISNHYGTLTQGRWNWLSLILLMATGAVVRLFFVLRHKGPNHWELLVPTALVLIGAVVVARHAAVDIDRGRVAERAAGRVRAGQGDRRRALRRVPQRRLREQERAARRAALHRRTCTRHRAAGGRVEGHADEQRDRHHRRRARDAGPLGGGGRKRTVIPRSVPRARVQRLNGP